MTTEIEKTFFDTFGIEPYDRYYNCKDNLEGECKLEQTCDICEKSEDVYCYPDITDRILLELICIHNTYLDANLYSLDYDSLKKEILKDLINEQESREFKKDYISDDMEHQVQALFKEQQNDN